VTLGFSLMGFSQSVEVFSGYGVRGRLIRWIGSGYGVRSWLMFCTGGACELWWEKRGEKGWCLLL
jgi:hypothetical protein